MSTPIITSPFPEGVLSAEHQAEVGKIRACLNSWIAATNDCRRKAPGAEDNMQSATEALLYLEVAAPYAFTPSPPELFKRVLLSCTRCYWLALVAFLDEQGKDEMTKRLDCVPPYGKRVPRFDGKRCIEKPGELNEREYEGLMRTIHLVALGMVSKDIVKSWYELGEVGVQTWEED
ncbi:hypothetical protein LshimejAT787_0404130 [Lyophyllum shimeji]|uniref:Uncharacterized protein n=1 Tax=Lyophyllum shimeji TaxID=47721 RepID=A0A9P3ULH0_LYOSH|nr:hypothetical protein LshimejAT787_0404130 [Lyophyllum shimeji]